jgi:hypothetical protein
LVERLRVNEYDLLLTAGQTDVKPLQTKIVVDLVGFVAIELTRENVGGRSFSAVATSE